MDLLDEGLLDFWRGLNKNSVRYIMVGGFAVTFNGYNRVTEDVDLLLDDNLENRKKLRNAFKELEYGDFASLETMQFARAGPIFTYHKELNLI